MPEIINLPIATSAADADIMILQAGGITYRVSLSVLKAYMGGSGLLNNLEGDGAPGTEDDSAAGYSIGSYWIDITSSPREAYRCVDATEGAAIWLNTTLEIAELGTAALVNMQAPTAENDVPVGSPGPSYSWIRKTLAQFKTILGWDTKADKVATSPDPTGFVATFTDAGNVTVSDKELLGIETLGTSIKQNAVRAIGFILLNPGGIVDGDSVTIDTKTYIFKDALSTSPTVEGEVLIGASDMASLQNLEFAIMHTGENGVNYQCAEAHPTVIARANEKAERCELQSIEAGESGNSIAMSVNCPVSNALTASESVLYDGTNGSVGNRGELYNGSDGPALYHCLNDNGVADRNWTPAGVRHSFDNLYPPTEEETGFQNGSLWTVLRENYETEVYINLYGSLECDNPQWMRIFPSVQSSDVSLIVTLTQAEYDALDPDPVETTLYIIAEEEA